MWVSRLMNATKTNITPPEIGRFHKSAEVMRDLGFTDKSAFWVFVKREGVPHIRLNARHIVFEPAALDGWLNRRRVGRAA